MFYTTDPKDRAEFIGSLRQLAEFLTANPAVPVPKYGADILLPADTYEDGGKEQVEHIARLLGAPINDRTQDGHYTAERSFGRLCYRVGSIPDTWNAAYDARRSYEDSIVLDTGEAVIAKPGECPCGYSYDPTGECPGSLHGCDWHREGPDDLEIRLNGRA